LGTFLLTKLTPKIARANKNRYNTFKRFVEQIKEHETKNYNKANATRHQKKNVRIQHRFYKKQEKQPENNNKNHKKGQTNEEKENI